MTNMSFSAKAISALTISLMLTLLPSQVRADGDKTEVTQKTKEVCVTQYGGGTDCKTEVISEEVVHDTTTVKAGIGDLSFTTLALMLGAGAVSLALISQVAQKAYARD